jgi:spore coat protein U-like protein
MKPASTRSQPSLSRSRDAGTRQLRAFVAVLLCAVAAPAAASVSCSLSAPAMAFGPYDVFAGTAITSSSTISVTCTLTGNVTTTVNGSLALSTGASGTYVQRTMKSGANSLGYNLYTSAALTTVWGDGTGGTQVVSGSLTLTSASRVQSVTVDVFGSVPALQDAKVGVYADNVTMTVTY